MKTTMRTTNLLQMCAIGALVFVAGCDDSITDFGFSGSISGMITDQSGNPVRGNSATTDLRVFVLGEGELEPLEIRVKPDGSYQNTHLFPQVYSVWIEGPVVTTQGASSPATVDLTGAAMTHDITVTPFLTLADPAVSQPSGTSVEVTYNITPVGASAVGNSVVWVSTVPWPGPTTGSVVPDLRTHTVQTTLSGASGTVVVNNLNPDRQYYVRIGSRAEGSTFWNYSNQVEIETN